MAGFVDQQDRQSHAVAAFFTSHLQHQQSWTFSQLAKIEKK